jgi:CheY-like chemotaxis protein
MTSTLLLADGNPTIQRIVAMTFAGEDMKIVSVSDGDQAIARIASDRPDIVLADVSMPKRSGYDVAAFVKGRPELAHIPVLLLAGALEPVDQARAAQVGCDGVLIKPFEPHQVVARVRELVRGGKGSPAQSTSGVPRPIDRLMESRAAAPEAPPKVVQHPSVPPASASPPPVVAPAAKPAAEFRAAAAPPVDDPLADYFDQLDAAFDHLDPPRMLGSRRAAAHEDETEQLEVPTLNTVLGDFGRDAARPPREPAPVFKDQILFAAPPVEPPDIRSVPPATLRDTPSFRAPLPEPTVEPLPEPRFEPVSARAPEPAPAPPGAPPPAPSFDLDLHTAADAFDALLTVDGQVREEEQAKEEQAKEEQAVVTEALIDAVATRVIERLAPNGVTELVSRVISDVAERLVREEIDRIRGRK